MIRFLLAAVMAVFLCLPSVAQDCIPFDGLVGEISTTGVPLHVFTKGELEEITPALEEISGKDLEGATRAFIFASPKGLVVGVEIDGCVIEPILISAPEQEPLSGRDSEGNVGA